jgi:hypothetical protein
VSVARKLKNYQIFKAYHAELPHRGGPLAERDAVLRQT